MQIVPQSMPSTPRLRLAITAIALVFVALFVANTFVQSSTSHERASAYFSAEQIERGNQFTTERKLLSWAGTGLQLALLTALVCTPLSRRLTDLVSRLAGGRWLLTLLLVGALYLLLTELLWLPLGLARLEQARAWQMTNRTALAWLADWAKELCVNAVQGAIAIVGLYILIRLFPRRWWLPAAAGAALLALLYVFLMPELIQPLFNKFTPLDDAYLRQRVRVLAARADVPVDEVLVMDASARGRHTNAYFTGLGSTRRIVLYDTLLQTHSGIDPASTAGLVGLLSATAPAGPLVGASAIMAARTQGDDELETILAHEMGHWRHQHIVKGLLLGSAACLVGFFLLSRILLWAVARRPFGLTAPADPAGLPLIMLLVTLSAWLTMPLQNGISRYFERQADRDSLELARKPAAFIEAEKRLALDNISNLAPTPFSVWMFSTHPPAVERIEMARQWAGAGSKD
jgi:STE24 endopeptidase